MFFESPLGDWLQISAQPGWGELASLCKYISWCNWSSETHGSPRRGMSSVTLSSPPSLRCAMRQCGSTVTAGWLFAGVKDIKAQSRSTLESKMLGTAGTVLCSLGDAVYRLSLWLSTMMPRAGYALWLFSLRSFVWPQILHQRLTACEKNRQIILSKYAPAHVCVTCHCPSLVCVQSIVVPMTTEPPAAPSLAGRFDLKRVCCQTQRGDWCSLSPSLCLSLSLCT